MEKHAYIKMIESNVAPNNPEYDAYEFMSDLYIACGKAAGVNHDHATDTDLDRIPGGYIDDGTEDHIFDENRPYNGDDS